MFANPVSDKEMDHINPILEYNNIKDILRRSKKKIKIKKVCATLDNFRIMLSEGTRLFHFAGHGCKKNLVFENNDGTAYSFNDNDLFKFQNEMADFEREL